MGLNNEERYNLVKYKIEKAFLTLEEAKATANGKNLLLFPLLEIWS